MFTISTKNDSEINIPICENNNQLAMDIRIPKELLKDMDDTTVTTLEFRLAPGDSESVFDDNITLSAGTPFFVALPGTLLFIWISP